MSKVTLNNVIYDKLKTERNWVTDPTLIEIGWPAAFDGYYLTLDDPFCTLDGVTKAVLASGIPGTMSEFTRSGNSVRFLIKFEV